MRDTDRHIDRPAGRQKGLRGHLMRSHLTIAGIGVVILVLAVSTSLVLRGVAMRLATESGPTAREAERVRAGLGQSLASLRGWMALGDANMPLARRQAWEDDIRPGLVILKQTALDRDDAITRSELDQLTPILAELEQWQWHIEDVCRTPGNDPARAMVELRLDPVAIEASSAIGALLEATEDQKRRLMLWEVRHRLSSCELAVRRFLDEEEIDRAKSLRRELEQLASTHEFLRPEGESSAGDEVNLLSSLDDALRAYAVIGTEIIESRITDTSNIAVKWLRDKALPCVSRAHEILEGIRLRERDRMAADADRVQAAGNIVLIGGPFLLAVLTVVTTFRARSSSAHIMAPIERLAEASRGLAAGTLEKSIPRTTDDELGDLTDCFNQMRISVREREDKVRRVAALESRNSSLLKFAHCASHDMKAPLVTIQGFCSVLRNRVSAGRLDELDHFVDRITGGVSRMQSTIDGLLEYCRAGHDAAETEVVQPSEMVTELLEDFASDINASHAEVVVQPDMPAIRINRARFEQVFHNLISNALKYGHSSESSVRISISAHDTDEEIRFVVEDHGPGISMQSQTKIFDLFQRLESTSGTGVGLAIVKEVAEANGGRAWVESEPGKGARFYTAFPRILVA